MNYEFVEDEFEWDPNDILRSKEGLEWLNEHIRRYGYWYPSKGPEQYADYWEERKKYTDSMREKLEINAMKLMYIQGPVMNPNMIMDHFIDQLENVPKNITVDELLKMLEKSE